MMPEDRRRLVLVAFQQHLAGNRGERPSPIATILILVRHRRLSSDTAEARAIPAIVTTGPSCQVEPTAPQSSPREERGLQSLSFARCLSRTVDPI